MKTIQVPTHTQVSSQNQAIFDNLKQQIGKVPNLYATLALSDVALKANLDFAGAFEKSDFTNKEAQAVYLAVSEVNQCTYCLAAHTALAQMNGFTEDETFLLRAATIEDVKLKALTQLAKSISENKGRPTEELVDNFFKAGYNEAALINLIGLVSAKIFSNFVHNTTKIPVDFPAAKPLEEVTI